jgi:ABC-type lipopolysaccharide export system ATPase subunit
MKHTLEADGIRLSFDGRPVLSDIYLQICTGNIVGLLGRNGCGKSTLLQVIFGVQPAEKSVRLNKQPLAEAYRKRGSISYLPQFHYIPKMLTVRTALEHHECDKEKFLHWFPEFSKSIQQKTGSLSGGERRIVELYIQLARPVAFVLLDEPFAQLSPLQTERVKQLLLEQREQKGIMLTDHLYREVINVADRLFLLKEGALKKAANAKDLEDMGYLTARNA